MYYEELDIDYKNSLQEKLRTNRTIESIDSINITPTNTINTYNDENISPYDNAKPKEIVKIKSEDNMTQKSISSELNDIPKKKLENPYRKYINQKASFIPIYTNKNVMNN